MYFLAAVAISARSARSSEKFASSYGSKLPLQRQENTDRNKVCKIKLYYSSKFRALRSTKISNTFLYNSKPRDVIKLGLPVDKQSFSKALFSLVYVAILKQ